MAASMLEGPVRSASAELQVASPAGAAAAAQAKSPALVIVDLGSPIADVAGLLQSIRDAHSNARLVAFGPHVHREKLQQAQDAGCDRVMSRGEFFSKAVDVIAGA